MLNRATIIGHLGADPESRSMQNGGKVVTLRIATSERWKDRNSGEKMERTEWHTVTIFNEALGETAAKYLRKGSKCLVEGMLQTRKWQHQDGGDRWSTEIVLKNFDAKLVLLDRAEGGGRNYEDHLSGKPRDGGGGRGGSQGMDDRTRSAFGSDPFASDLDDDVPF
jgi:single-strand DNA-binding protein